MTTTQQSLQLAKMLAENLKNSLNEIKTGMINRETLIQNLIDASQFLEKAFLDRQPALMEDIFSDTDTELPENVQEWISSTFTMQPKMAPAPRKRLRSLINAVRVGMYFDKAFRKMSLTGTIAIPPGAQLYIKQHFNDWSFDVFHFNNLTNNHSMKALGYELLHCNHLISKFSIDITVLEAFLDRLEEGYSLHKNPYHNLIHAADVAHTSFLLISKSRLFSWMSDLELLAIIISALIHDFEHTGTTNNYHVMTSSDLALIYNDKSVLENYHLSSSFRVLRDDRFNILQSLNAVEYREFRNMVIEMVLATDMSAHFKQVQSMKDAVLLSDNLQKGSILSYVLHAADISHPCKPWDLHFNWTNMVVEEFFRQGDIERASGLQCSPLCDRHSTLIPQSQIGFINFIVDPCFNVLGDILKAVAVICPEESTSNCVDDDSDTAVVESPKEEYPWVTLLSANKASWTEIVQKKANIPPIQEESENDE